jgi:hypothetical protein
MILLSGERSPRQVCGATRQRNAKSSFVNGVFKNVACDTFNKKQFFAYRVSIDPLASRAVSHERKIVFLRVIGVGSLRIEGDLRNLSPLSLT